MGESNHNGHRERLRKRFLKQGLEHFEAHEVLELLTYHTISRKNTNELGHLLIEQFGSLANVFDASYEDLMLVDGVGEKTAFLIKLVAPVCKRYLDDKYSEGFVIDSLPKAGEFMYHKFVDKVDEVVYVACLDNKSKVVTCQKVFTGSINATQVSIRKIVEFSVRNNAVGVVIAHNHPSGIALPSPDDVTTTKKLQTALDLVEVRLLDHVIVAGDDYVSLAESGMIGPYGNP